MNTLKDFYYFYNEIPEEKWCVGAMERDGKCCFWGHLGERQHRRTKLSDKIDTLLGDHNGDPVFVNDGYDSCYKQETPKQRVLAFLIDKINEKEDETFKG
jgi:hypothetical protein